MKLKTIHFHLRLWIFFLVGFSFCPVVPFELNLIRICCVLSVGSSFLVAIIDFFGFRLKFLQRKTWTHNLCFFFMKLNFAGRTFQGQGTDWPVSCDRLAWLHQRMVCNYCHLLSSAWLQNGTVCRQWYWHCHLVQLLLYFRYPVDLVRYVSPNSG